MMFNGMRLAELMPLLFAVGIVRRGRFFRRARAAETPLPSNALVDDGTAGDPVLFDDGAAGHPVLIDA